MIKTISNTSTNNEPIQQTTSHMAPEGMRARKAKTSYMHFINCEDNRKSVMSEYETHQPGQKIPPKTLVSMLASRWRLLSEEDKQPYQNLFIQEKEKLSCTPEWLPKKQKKPDSSRPPKDNTLNQDLQLQIQHLKTEQTKQQQQIILLTQIVQKLSSTSNYNT